MTSLPELNDFLARLNARRERLTVLAERGRVRDAEELLEEVDELGEQLMQADEELRTQQAELDEASHVLQMLAARNEELFEASSCAFVVTDRDGHELRRNRRAVALIADAPARRTVRPLATRFALADRSAIRSMINQAGREAEESTAQFTGEAAVLRSDGTTVPVRVLVRVHREATLGTSTLLWELVPRPHVAVDGDRVAEASERLLESGAPADATPAELLDRLLELAVSVVPGAEHASVSLVHADGQVETRAASSALATECDQAQLDVGEGPGLQPIADLGGVLVIDELRSEQRWARFAKRAGDLGVQSVLALQLPTPHGTLGFFNLYAGEAAAFDAESVLIGKALASQMAVALALADREQELRQVIDSGEPIGRAIAVLMTRHYRSAGSAFDALVTVSCSRQIELGELARLVVDGGGPLSSVPALGG